jgi:hypothetical protein
MQKSQQMTMMMTVETVPSLHARVARDCFGNTFDICATAAQKLHPNITSCFPSNTRPPWSVVLGVLPALHGLQVARTITRIEDIACFIV